MARQESLPGDRRRAVSSGVGFFPEKGPAGSKPISLEYHEKFLTEVVYQNSGETLASGCEEGTVAPWHLTAKNPLPTSLRMRTEVTRLAWSPDDCALAVGDADGLISLMRVF